MVISLGGRRMHAWICANAIYGSVEIADEQNRSPSHGRWLQPQSAVPHARDDRLSHLQTSDQERRLNPAAVFVLRARDSSRLCVTLLRLRPQAAQRVCHPPSTHVHSLRHRSGGRKLLLPVRLAAAVRPGTSTRKPRCDGRELPGALGGSIGRVPDAHRVPWLPILLASPECHALLPVRS